MPPRRGTSVVDGEHATLTFHRVYPHRIEHVWEAISTREGLSQWLMCTRADIDARVGGHIELITGPTAYHSTGRITAWQPPRLFEFEWNVAPLPEMPRGENALFRFELSPLADGATRLVVTYLRITKQTAVGFLPGLHAFLDRLEAQLEGATLPDWLQRFEALRAEYPDWGGH
ncbi:MAG: SRPBCC domain-containing protein [Myxococcaceae bacterium]|nr:SRPBCC domain-containing protein [Myxococcaceae bacterium]